MTEVVHNHVYADLLKHHPYYTRIPKSYTDTQHLVSTITFGAMGRPPIVLSRGAPLSNCTYEGYRKQARSREPVTGIPDLADVVTRQRRTHKSVVFA